MQPEPGRGQLPDEAPLPPATTQWRAPAAPVEETAGQLLGPFVPSHSRLESVSPLQATSAPEATAAPEHPQAEPAPLADEAAESEPAAASLEAPAAPEAALEPMPWEEELPPRLESGPTLLREAPHDTVAPAEVEAWAAALPEEAGRAVPPWEDEGFSAPGETGAETGTGGYLPGEPASGEHRDFPLDAFIIPEDSRRIPAGVELSETLRRQIADEVAERLEQMAARLRAQGLDALLAPSPEHEPVDVVLAAVISGYIARKAH